MPRVRRVTFIGSRKAPDLDTNIQQHKGRFFWRDMGPSGHACQVYGDSADLIDSLTAYVGGALWTGEASVVIATRENLDRLEHNLRQSGLDLAHFRGDDRYITISADDGLARFMVDNWPDEARFREVIGALLERARRGGRPVRAYGEMVGVLWARGDYQAAIRLEHLWNRMVEGHGFRLLCGYSRAEFERAGTGEMDAARAAHSLVGD